MNNDYLRWRMTFQSDESAARSAYAQITELQNENEMLKLLFKDKTCISCRRLKLSLFLTVCLFLFSASWVYADTRKAVIGPQPGKDFIAEIKKDCIKTINAIAARPGASWNSEFGWAHQYQCSWASVDNQNILADRIEKVSFGKIQIH